MTNYLCGSTDSRYNIGYESVLITPTRTLIKVHVEGVTMTTQDSNLNLPVKQCSKCGVLYPATHEFFKPSKSNKSGLNSWCRECYRKEARIYYAEHTDQCRKSNKRCRAANPNAHREANRRWDIANRDKRRASNRKWQDTNPDAVKAKYKRYYLAHREEIVARQHENRSANHERFLDAQRRYRIANRDKRSAYAHARRARQLASGGSDIPFDEKMQLKRQKSKCYYCQCKLDVYHIEHIVPLSRGGSDHPDNKVLACPTCNFSKNNKLPHEWSKGGRLL